MLQPLVFPDHEALSRWAADFLFERLRQEPSALICLAAGSTPARTYELLAARGAADQALFARCRLLQLDEWGGLATHDHATCSAQLRATLINPLGLADRYNSFDSQASNPEADCRRIADWLDLNGPIDTCVLGLGLNGHLGFNEPAEFLRPHAHVAKLSDTSLAHVMLQQSERLPTHGLTLGMADLLQSRHVLLLVSGAAKRIALRRLLGGHITTQFPASLLHLHSQVALLCDTAATKTVEMLAD